MNVCDRRKGANEINIVRVALTMAVNVRDLFLMVTLVLEGQDEDKR